MTDLVFSQLDELGSDVFSKFMPYAPSEDDTFGFNYNSSFKDDNSYLTSSLSNSNTYNSLLSKKEPKEIYNKLKVKVLTLQDHNGSDLNSKAISDINLITSNYFFGLEYEHSVNGRSITEFLSKDITSIIRQGDRVGLYITFQRKLKSKKIDKKLSLKSMTSSDYGIMYKDSPFSRTFYIVLFFLFTTKTQH